MNTETDQNLNGYPNEIMQALINILNNAKDQLLHCEYDRFIFITTGRDDNNFIIKIKDNGGGIKDGVINRIFEPYFTTKDDSKGTGIGLHMTKEIIVDHSNGSIEAKNTEYEYKGKKYTGAEFIIKLPIA